MNDTNYYGDIHSVIFVSIMNEIDIKKGETVKQQKKDIVYHIRKQFSKPVENFLFNVKI